MRVGAAKLNSLHVVWTEAQEYTKVVLREDASLKVLRAACLTLDLHQAMSTARCNTLHVHTSQKRPTGRGFCEAHKMGKYNKTY